MRHMTSSRSWHDGRTGRVSSLRPFRQARLTFDWADVTLEVYSVGACDQFPSAAVSFTDMTILDGAGAAATAPAWDVTTTTTCDGELTISADALSDITISHDPSA